MLDRPQPTIPTLQMANGEGWEVVGADGKRRWFRAYSAALACFAAIKFGANLRAAGKRDE